MHSNFGVLCETIFFLFPHDNANPAFLLNKTKLPTSTTSYLIHIYLLFQGFESLGSSNSDSY